MSLENENRRFKICGGKNKYCTYYKQNVNTLP